MRSSAAFPAVSVAHDYTRVIVFWQFRIDDIEHQNQLVARPRLQALRSREEAAGDHPTVAPPTVSPVQMTLFPSTTVTVPDLPGGR